MATTISGSSGINTQGVTSSGTVSGATVTSSGTVSGATVASSGDVDDTVGNVRTPKFTTVSSSTEITASGVYHVTASATITFGTAAGELEAGDIVVIYNDHSAGITIEDGDFTTFVKDGETGIRLLTQNECKAIMGFPDDFVIPVSRTQMYRQMGNSVVIKVVSEIAKEIDKALCSYNENRCKQVS